MRQRVLITGATGFVGRALLGRLREERAYRLRVAVRSEDHGLPEGVETVRVAGLAPDADWGPALEDVSVVVHLAARVHAMGESSEVLPEYRRVNVAGTLQLARQAAAAGVRRFVFLSSIKVNGERTGVGRPFRADQPPAPEDPYGISKWEAEQGLLALARETGMEVVIIRSPLVYGPEARGNFARLKRWVERGLPLPLGAVVHNRRSLIGIDNLTDLIVRCIAHRAAANQVFLAADGESLSTAELLRRLAQAMGKRPRLVHVPVPWLRRLAEWLGQGDAARRLLDSLEVDIAKTREVLGWAPPLTVDEGLRRAVSRGPSRPASRGWQRVCDVVLAGAGLVVLSPLLLVLWLAGFLDTGSPLFWQERVGRHMKPFRLVKFRTMRPETPSVATHLANPSAVTKWGAFLRRTKLDELPQLWNVLKGDMSLVGARPCLFNQTELIVARRMRGVFDARPGITGLAQIQGIDMSTPELLAETDARMLQTLTMKTYFSYIFQTVTGAGRGDRVRA